MTPELLVMIFVQICIILFMIVLIATMVTTIVDYWRVFFTHVCKYKEKWKEIRVGPLKDGDIYIGHYSDYIRHCSKCGNPEHKRVEWKDENS